jgi:site-specific DNA recombinase
MECAHQTRRTGRYEYFYYNCRHNDPVETGREQRCTARRVRRDELDAVVWDALVSWIQSPQMLVEEIAAWRASRAGAAQVARDLARLEAVQRQTRLQIERLIDAYQRGALGVEELKGRRERLEPTFRRYGIGFPPPLYDGCQQFAKLAAGTPRKPRSRRWSSFSSGSNRCTT